MKKLTVTSAGRESGKWVLYMECPDGIHRVIPEVAEYSVRALVSNGIIDAPQGLHPVTLSTEPNNSEVTFAP
jgi:hypothetical protein